MNEWPVWFRFALAVLATWRLAHLVAREDGPFGLIVRARARAGHGALGQLMDCPYCLSLWIAAPWAFWIASGPVDLLAAWLAASGGASLLERVTSRFEPEA
jgi:hypothetical protein